MKQATQQPNHISRLLALLLFWMIGISVAQATAVPQLSIKSAAYNKKTASLVVKTSVKNTSGLVSLIHSKGGVLGQTSDSEHTFSIPMAQVGDIPCQVEARLGEMKISKAVSGASAECSKVPTCKILPFARNTRPLFNVPFTFEAQVKLNDKKAAPLTVEWDFAGGVMGHPYERLLKDGKAVISGKVKNEATFIRDNSRYHVRFAAMDALGRRCESGTYVDIGNPPTDLPDPMALEDMVKSSQANAPQKGHALQQPEGAKIVLPYQDWTMQTASDARTVPNLVVVYGPTVNNINATVYQKARQPAVVEADKIELKYSAASNPADPVGPNSINSTSQNWPVGESLMTASIQKSDYFETYTRPSDGYTSYSFTGFLNPALATAMDEGYHDSELSPPLNADHGRYMPGIAAPYGVNDPQPFSEYVAEDNRFAARMLPLTDIDDKGRVNPFPLYRIEANDIGSDSAIAATDIVANSGRDLHCRECHAKGKMGADPAYGATIGFNFVEADSDSIFDQEYAAIANLVSPHAHTPISHEDGPVNCANSNSCHTSAFSTTAFGKPLGSLYRGSQLSIRVHLQHENYQYNANKDDVVRDSSARAKSADPWVDWNATTGSVPDSLFPVKDANGKILPMEDNCLKCHGGQREQSYRDRMYTAGVTCYQCHGGMSALSSYKKSIPGVDGRILREPWIDEPDCGSCHTGNANLGKNGNAEFFSGGVRRQAFDNNDISATPFQPDRLNPDEVRFAVPISDLALGKTDTSEQPVITKAPLYRVGKDNHGQVACAACHGPAHGIWPNRDPNSNDNVTSLQLQGHTGPIAECSVCHTANAFANFLDLDEGIRAADPKTGVLGGPHNMHPINDPNWWKGAAGDNTLNADGTTTGGWHNDYAKIKGRLGEDQCAACHGNDHLGTRLSKTPVDREFITAKGKKISVKAGTAIGCNLCHTIEKSCTHSPAGSDCGKPSEKVTQSVNRAPVITSSTDTTVVIGEDYHHVVTATDPDGDEVSYQLDALSIPEMSIDATTGVITLPASNAIFNWQSNADISHLLTAEFYVAAYDNKGAKAVKLVRILADCPTGLIWNGHMCDKLKLASQSPVYGLNAGETYRYQVVALQRSGEPLSYSLSGQPAGMTIGANTGLINWVVPGKLSGIFNFTVSASNKHGDKVDQAIALTVCAAPQHWDGLTKSCPGPIQITSRPATIGANPGDTYSYQVIATDDNNLSITYSLTNAPDGMTIDAQTGLVNWLVQPSATGNASYTVNARDSQGAFAQQQDYLAVCIAPELWTRRGCKGPIDFTSTPSINGVDVGQTYQYQAVASHANGLKLTYSLGDYFELGQSFPPRPAGMTIDPNTGLISWVAEAQSSENYGNNAYYSVIATDSNGYVTKQPQKISISVCDPPTNWDESWFMCRGPLRITSTQPVQGLDVGQTFSYQVTATDNDPTGLPITYTLTDATVPGATIDSNTGLITWLAEDMTNYGGFMYFNITVTDQQQRQETQSIAINTCVLPDHWDAVNGYCTH